MNEIKTVSRSNLAKNFAELPTEYWNTPCSLSKVIYVLYLIIFVFVLYTDWLIDWLNEWMNDWMIEWLICCFVKILSEASGKGSVVYHTIQKHLILDEYPLLVDKMLAWVQDQNIEVPGTHIFTF